MDLVDSFFYCAMLFLSEASPMPMGPYKLTFKSTGQCEDMGTNELQYNIYLSKVTLTKTVLKGNITTLIPINGDITLKVDTDIWGTGGWKKHPFTVTLNACSKLSVVAVQITEFITDCISTKQKTLKCPIEAGTCILNEYDVDRFNHVEGMPFLVYGIWRLTITFYHKTRGIVGCTSTTIEIVPKVIFR